MKFIKAPNKNLAKLPNKNVNPINCVHYCGMFFPIIALPDPDYR